jgi:hypothetical protein
MSDNIVTLDTTKALVEAKNKLLEAARVAPLITSDMWQNDKEKAIKLAVGYHFATFMQSLVDMRDENGKRPEFDFREIVDCVYDNMQASRVQYFAYDILMSLKDVVSMEERRDKVGKHLDYVASNEKFNAEVFTSLVEREVCERLKGDKSE